ncbi:MAG: ABC transporter permease, partial [bacterium]
MLAYLIRRVLLAIPVMLVVAAGVFLLLYLTPGDPVSVILGPDASPQRVDELRQQLGLDQPVAVQVTRWFGQLLHGAMNMSTHDCRLDLRPGIERYECHINAYLPEERHRLDLRPSPGRSAGKLQH